MTRPLRFSGRHLYCQPRCARRRASGGRPIVRAASGRGNDTARWHPVRGKSTAGPRHLEWPFRSVRDRRAPVPIPFSHAEGSCTHSGSAVRGRRQPGITSPQAGQGYTNPADTIGAGNVRSPSAAASASRSTIHQGGVFVKGRIGQDQRVVGGNHQGGGSACSDRNSETEDRIEAGGTEQRQRRRACAWPR